MTLFLARHAKARERSTWAGDDDLRPLNEQGREQAHRIAALLADTALEAVSSSPSVRCIETVQPLAQVRGLQVNADDALAEGNARKAIALVESLVAVDALLCTHGDVIPDVLQTLSDSGMQMTDSLRWQKGSLWVLHTTDGRFQRASYIPAAK